MNRMQVFNYVIIVYKLATTKILTILRFCLHTNLLGNATNIFSLSKTLPEKNQTHRS